MKKINILGAIAGDTIGSVYEFAPTKDYHFNFYDPRMNYTDDSILTIAVADWLLHCPEKSHEALAERMRYWGRKYRYPMGSYGSSFAQWLDHPNAGPYGSWGNGAAMRVSPVGFAFDNLEETLRVARISAEVTHNHPEGIRGAEATAAAIFLARQGQSKTELRNFLTDRFHYFLDTTCAALRPTYHFEGSCQETVPQSIVAFLESRNLEDAIRLTVSLGGDADTMGAITGAIAAAYYGEMTDELYTFTLSRLPEDLKAVVLEFETRFGCGTSAPDTVRRDTPVHPAFTPEKITALKPGEIFVFGSNLQGYHGGGAARAALEHFGAVWGVGVGLQGQSYAIPTMQGGVETIAPYVDQFIAFAQAHPELTFLVTPIGCGIAGFREEEIAPLFRQAVAVDNIVLPEGFLKVLSIR